MKLFLTFLFIFLVKVTVSQDISGKWYGKLTQGPGGYAYSYDYELDLIQKKTIRGESYAKYKNSVFIKIGLSGRIDRDSIRLNEYEEWISQDIVPPRWLACIKNIHLKYRKVDNEEFLEGRWDGISEGEGIPCVPGQVILARTSSALNKFLVESISANRKIDTTKNINSSTGITAATNSTTNLNFGDPFLNTQPSRVTEIIVHSTDLQFQLIDYMKVDDDTVSVYLNREPLVRNVSITKQPTFVHFRIDPKVVLHELLLYAENLGKYSPNTSELVIIDGDSSFRMMIESDKQKTAAVYLRYEPL